MTANLCLYPAEKFQQLLFEWFDHHGRKDLPWQQDITPYRVWLSEIMLQQTQVSNVIPYFNRFVERFPTLASLASAEVDEVLRLWSGLGYYARARNLHKTAQLLITADGEFPLSVAELSKLPGIGLSTAGAILSIAYTQSQPILDGNVRRVLTRFHAIYGWPGESRISAKLWEISRYYTCKLRPAAYTQAIMDLGATLCTRSKPQCMACPLALACQALALDQVKQLPTPKLRKRLPVKQLYFLLLRNCAGEILLEKRPSLGIWGGLWSLPEFNDVHQLEDWQISRNIAMTLQSPLPSQRHTFSHYHLDYIPLPAILINPTNNVMEANVSLWYKSTPIESLGLPAPIKRLLQQFQIEVNDDKNG